MTDASDLETNPLVRETFRIPFHEIEAAHVEPAVEALLAQAEAELRALVELPEGTVRTRKNTLDVFEELGRGLEWAVGVVAHLESVVTSEPLREAYEAVQPKVSAFGSKVFQDAGLYRAIHEFAATDEAAALDPTAARMLKNTLAAFRRNGAELDEAGKARLTAIDIELAKLTLDFSQNTLDDINSFELLVGDEARLAGLPESAREAARASAAQKGQDGWRLTLQAPSWIPVMLYLDDRELRRTIWTALNDRASSGEHDNRDLVVRILRLRQEKATLLGYANFADLVLEDRMAQDGAAARGFVDDLRRRSEPFFAEESEALKAFVREQDPDYGELQGWDVAYWSERQRKALYDFDDEQLRPYFPLESVLSGMFDLAHRLYGISVEVVDDLPTWHESVRTYRIRDGEHDLGCFYADLHPRESKRPGAWMNSLVTGLPRAGRPHLGLICANLNEALGDKPALLTHREVETVFHEFGHLLHHMLSEVEIPSLAGTNVAWDFVELP
ncbi:MAG: M3 family metallopeptidase, partial [Myxococcales bacterium]|nr:M3 family metallopeptidase [Myxococcales bacterium]